MTQKGRLHKVEIPTVENQNHQEKPWIAIRRARKNLSCDIHLEDCNDIAKGDLYEHHFHFCGHNYRVCEHCSINSELFDQKKPLNFTEIQKIWRV